MTNKRGVYLGFAAEHELAPAGLEPALRAAALADAIVDPERQPRKLTFQPYQRGTVVFPARDGIEVGDIKRSKRVDRKQPTRHIHGIACWREGRRDRPILIALPHPGTNHDAAHNVDDGNDLHAHCPSPETLP